MVMHILLSLCVVLMVIISGCSGSSAPVSPDDSIMDSSVPVNDNDSSDSNRVLLGIWDVTFDINHSPACSTLSRNSSSHFNVTGLIPAPDIHINSFDPGTETIDVDITISNPYPADVFDVRLIIFTDIVGHLLENSDNWTSLYDIPGGEDINPFKAYAKDQQNRVFTSQSQHTENLLIHLPGGNPVVSFAIDASYPGNCEEPYKIDDFEIDKLFDEINSTANMKVNVPDWQDNVDAVQLFCPEVLGASPVSFVQMDSERWEGVIVNNTGALSGSYNGYIHATSEDSGSLALYDLVYISVNSKQTGWARTWGGLDPDDLSDQCHDIAIDDEGNIFVTGYFNDTVDFDPSAWVNEINSNGQTDVFISRFDIEGNYYWTRTWGGPGIEKGFEVAVDTSSNLYVTGFFQETVDFDPGVGIEEHTSIGTADVFLSKFDYEGNFIWAKTWSAVYRDHLEELEPPELSSGLILLNDEIFISGGFIEEVDFDPGPGEELRAAIAEFDCYLSKFDLNGNFQWVHTWGGSGNDGSTGLASDGLSSVYVAGNCEGTIDFDPTELGLDLHELCDMFLSKFDFDGRFIWARTWGPYASVCHEVTTDEVDNVYIVGKFHSYMDFDPGPDFDGGPGGAGYNMFLICLDSSGIYRWGQMWGFNPNEEAYYATSDSKGNVFFTGYFIDQIDFDPTSAEDWHYCPTGHTSAFVYKTDLTGDYHWVRCLCSWDHKKGMSMATDRFNNIYMVGFFGGELDFDPGPAEEMHYCNGDYDAFIMKLGRNGDME